MVIFTSYHIAFGNNLVITLKKYHQALMEGAMALLLKTIKSYTGAPPARRARPSQVRPLKWRRAAAAAFYFFKSR